MRFLSDKKKKNPSIFLHPLHLYLSSSFSSPSLSTSLVFSPHAFLLRPLSLHTNGMCAILPWMPDGKSFALEISTAVSLWSLLMITTYSIKKKKVSGVSQQERMAETPLAFLSSSYPSLRYTSRPILTLDFLQESSRTELNYSMNDKRGNTFQMFSCCV